MFRRHLVAYLLAMFILGAGLLVYELIVPVFPIHEGLRTTELDKSNVIAHAMGGIEGESYTNSLEAFRKNYEKGFRIFEVDLILTGDNRVVAMHDGSEVHYGLTGDISSFEATEFLRARYKGKFTPLDFKDIINIMSSHRDVFIVMDIKSDFGRTFNVIDGMISVVDRNLYSRVIPQIYAEDDYEKVMNYYNFPRIIYTLYRQGPSGRLKIFNYLLGRRVVRFIMDKDEIDTVTIHRVRFMKSGWLVKKLILTGRGVFVHTLNDPAEIEKYLSLGAGGIYTDFFAFGK